MPIFTVRTRRGEAARGYSKSAAARVKASAMNIVIGSEDKYLSANLRRIVQDQKIFAISTNRVERILKEMKMRDRAAVLDVSWKALQEPGVLKQIVNIARISGNFVICVCPNQEEDLKKLAKASRAHSVFIRYDLETTFKERIGELYLESGATR